MKKFLYIFALCLCAVSGVAQKRAVRHKDADVDVVGRYGRAIDSLALLRDSAAVDTVVEGRPSAYLLRLFAPATFYHSSVLQQFSPGFQTESTDVQVLRNRLANEVLASLYAGNPSLVTRTASVLEDAGYVREDVDASLKYDALLSDQIDDVSLSPMFEEGDMSLHVRKPNFWRFYGSSSLQFTQSYFSENWYQGGDKSYSAMVLLNLNMNYDDKRNIQWENALDVQIGFQTVEGDEKRNFKPTNNMLRLNTKFGYKAIKNFYYTTQLRVQTQIVPQYEKNSDKLITNFLNPLDLALSVGIDWKFEALKGKLKGNIYLAPGTYDLRFVSNMDLATRYGIEAEHHALHKFGPSATMTLNWQIFKNVSWNSRLYWILRGFSDTTIEWENTFNFTINKYLSAKFFIYPRYEDTKYYNNSETYFMLKEWLSLGLNYNF